MPKEKRGYTSCYKPNQYSLLYHSKRRHHCTFLKKPRCDIWYSYLLYILLNRFHPLLQIFEDEDDAVKYCDLLQGGGQGCEGIAEIEASSVSKLFGGP